MTDTLTLTQPTPLTTPPPTVTTMRLDMEAAARSGKNSGVSIASPHGCDACAGLQQQVAVQASELLRVQKQLEERDARLARLDQDMQQLNCKYVAAIDSVADIQHEKDLVEHDLEELSCKLFEEANDMVANEKKEKWLLETQLQAVQQLLADEQAQLKELRQRLHQWDHEQQKSRRKKRKPVAKRISNHSNSSTTASSSARSSSMSHHSLLVADETADTDMDDDMDEKDGKKDEEKGEKGDKDKKHAKDVKEDEEEAEDDEDDDDCWQDAMENMDDPQVRAQHDMALLHQPLSPTVAAPVSCSVDQAQLDAFADFVRGASNVPLKKLAQFAYIKACQLEDVEPCLRFGPQSRLSVKKMMDFLLHQPCCIEQATHATQHQMTDTPPPLPAAVAQRNLWDRWHSTPVQQQQQQQQLTLDASSQVNAAISCVACGRPRHDASNCYQFRLQDTDPWLPIDQFCRDRLVAVCEFFVYIRNIQLRLYTHRSIDDLYAENIRLRLQMFYSRLGALPVILNKVGLEPSSVGKASSPFTTP
ncbi:hypothetical protein BC940DRAFT_308168 [Gongronella butleri]|nr:hypothetical protein BC940DRAFT_308168 [Gongronella butleri]